MSTRVKLINGKKVINPDNVPCRHCRRTRANRPRGLCWCCYSNPHIVSLYPPEGKFVAAIWRIPGADEDFFGGYDLPSEPTIAPPGTEEKIQVLMQRAAQRVYLHHPCDAPMDRESRNLGIN